MNNRNLISLRQIDQEGLSGLLLSVSGSLLTGLSGFLASQVSVYSSEFAIPSGVDYVSVLFGHTFSGVPRVICDVACSGSGSAFIYSEVVDRTTSGCLISFSNYIPSDSYYGNLIAST